MLTAPLCATPQHPAHDGMAISGRLKAAGGQHPAQGSRLPRRLVVLTATPIHRAATAVSRYGQLFGGKGGGGLSTRADVAWLRCCCPRHEQPLHLRHNANPAGLGGSVTHTGISIGQAGDHLA